MPIPSPLFILASPHSHASLVAAMLGQHRDAYALPEVNLFAGETILETFDELAGPRIHGLLRTLAQLTTGEQTFESVDTARRWLFPRVHSSSDEVYMGICCKVAPLRIIDQSAMYTDPERPQCLERIRKAVPDAHFLHLVRHPRAQSGEWLKSPLALSQLFALRSLERDSNQTVVDPQLDWRLRQQGIVTFLDGVPDDRQMRVRSEDILADPRRQLQAVCQWLGLKWSERIYRALLHPERCSYSCTGPYGAELGNDPAFLASPAFHREALSLQDELERPLPWRPDSKSFLPEVVEMAQQFGYS
jgi:hypothetical protein